LLALLYSARLVGAICLSTRRVSTARRRSVAGRLRCSAFRRACLRVCAGPARCLSVDRRAPIPLRDWPACPLVSGAERREALACFASLLDSTCRTARIVAAMPC
jgi:hypothetical protein